MTHDHETKPVYERLPTSVSPIHYELQIRPDLLNRCFSGRVSVDVTINENTYSIKMNALELTIKQVKVLDVEEEKLGTTERDLKGFRLIKEHEQLEIQLQDVAVKGARLRVIVAFTGILNRNLRGFYLTEQKPGTYGAVCHFEATGARMAFPCWDEPVYRARYSISIEVPQDKQLVVLSNMPERESESLEQGMMKVSFETTPVIPSYLVCYSVGHYDATESHTDDGIPVRVFTPVGKADEGRFALQVAVKALEFYRDFFGIKYYLPKMDLIAIADFQIGAMENWGLLTFRERCILYNPEESSLSNKQNIALIVAHEVAHQWFGNYVSIEWWTHLWLKEGYASWIEFLCLDHVFPDWKIWTQFITDTLNPALKLDALQTSHPIEVVVKDPAEVEEVFDLISYNKGASIIRMLFNWIGKESFRSGMNKYLHNHALSNASTKDLWNDLEGDKPVSKVMSTWTEQSGYPVVTVKDFSFDSDTGRAILSLKQTHFSFTSSVSPYESNIWNIPYQITTASSPITPVFSGLLGDMEDTILLENLRPEDWINLNPHSVGYYLVCYTDGLLRMFYSGIENRTMPEEDRLKLLFDQMLLAKKGTLSTLTFLDLIEKYQEDDSFMVWECIASCISELRELFLGDEEGLHLFNRWISWLLEPAWKSLSWPHDDNKQSNHLKELRRALIIGMLVKSEDGNVVKKAHELVQRHLSSEDPFTLPADIRTSCYSAWLKTEGKLALKQLQTLATDGDTSAEEKIRIYNAMGATKDQSIIEESLEFAISNSVRSQDTRTILGSIANGSGKGSKMAWSFFKENKDIFKSRYSQGTTQGRIIKDILNCATDDEVGLDVETFFKAHSFPEAQMAVRQCVEAIKLKAEWKRRDKGAILSFIENRMKNIKEAA